MSVSIENLPPIICLEDYGGDYAKYIDAIYSVFYNDFIAHKVRLGKYELRMKYHPAVQDRAYTFYHMTHKGDVENERIPDFRRCERIPWARPTIEKTQILGLRFWEQTRSNYGRKHRICIWLETDTDDNYYVILEVRNGYILLWTAFYGDYPNAIKKKTTEYKEWKMSQDREYTLAELITKIIDEMKKQESPIT